MVLHRQYDYLANAVILLDEPERSLHADVCIRAIEELRRRFLSQGGQLWIATHSVPLLAYATLNNVWLVDSGEVRYAGNRIPETLAKLLGGSEGRSRVGSFFSDADTISFFNFAAQCLVPPSVSNLIDKHGGVSAIARKCGIPQPSLSRMLTSASIPRRSTLYKIANALDLSEVDIVSEWTR